MNTILIESNPDARRLTELGVDAWPEWSAGVSEFAWHYDTTETSYVLEGRVIVTPRSGSAVEIVTGDLVTFPAGMACTWKIIAPIRKRYRFG